MQAETAIGGNGSRTTVPEKGRRPSWLWFWLLIAPCTIGANRLAVWLASRAATKEGEGTVAPERSRLPVIVESKSLVFGEVWESDAFRWNVGFRNLTDSPVILRNIAGTCHCTKVGKGDLKLGPGEQAVLALVVDLRQIGAYDPVDVRPVEVGLTAQVAEQGHEFTEVQWVVRGRVGRPLHVEPHRMGLAEDVVVGEQGRTRLFKIRPNRAIRDLRLLQVPEGWKAELRRNKGVRPTGYELTISAEKRLPGPFADEFALEPISQDGKRLPVQRVKVEGYAVAPVEVLPQSNDLGRQQVGSRIRVSFWVATRTRQAVEGVEFLPKEETIKVVAIRHEGLAWHVEVEAAVRAAGPGEGRGIARVRLPRNRHYDLPVRFNWYGVVRAVRVKP